MSNSTYSEEEIKQLFQNLFQEKKKTKELEQKFQSLNDDHSKLKLENHQLMLTSKKDESEEVDKLKEMLAHYKKKNAQAVQALYENEQQKTKKDLSAVQQLAEAKTQIEELVQENNALSSQQMQLKAEIDQLESSNHSLDMENRYQEAVSENRKQLEEIEKLTVTLKEREKTIRDFQLTYKKMGEQRTALEIQIEKEIENSKALSQENEVLTKTVHENKTHNDNLERALKHLRERSQEAQLELNQFREESRRSQEAITNLTEQLKLIENKHQVQVLELQKVEAGKHEALDELEMLQSQFSVLKAKIAEGQEELKAALVNNTNLEEVVNEKTMLLSHTEIELALIKQTISKGINDVKIIETKHLELVNEKASLYNRSTQLQQSFEQQRDEIASLQQQLLQSTRREEELKVQNEQLQQSLKSQKQEILSQQQTRTQELETNLHRHSDLLRQRDQQIEDYSKQVTQLTQEKYKLEDSLANTTRYQDEQEARIKVAQQHLGKKVKEVALLNEKIEEQKNLVNESQSSLNQLKSKIAEMQTSFDIQMQQERKMQDQLHETVRFSESQVVKWEEKYIKTYEKLKVFEEKQQQMQALFSSLGSVIGNNQTLVSPSSSAPVPQQVVQNKNTIQLVDTTHLQQQSFLEESPQRMEESLPNHPLFDFEQPRNRLRQNLFE